MKALCVAPDLAPQVWPHVSELLRNVMRKCDQGSFAEVEREVLAGRALLWIAWDEETHGAAVTQLIKTEVSKVCRIAVCGGKNASRWVGLISEIEKYAKAEGCDCVRTTGRKAWARLLPNYTQTRVVLERKL